MPTGTEETQMNVDGIDLYYEYEDGPGIPRVYLNGIAMSVSHWKPLRRFLPPSAELLHDFKDQLRSGKSSQAYDMQSHADELALLLDALSIDTAYLIGTSYGAEVALLFALTYPQRCAGLVIIDGVSESDARLKAAVDSWKAAALSDPRVFYRMLIPWNYSPAYIEANIEALLEREELVASLPREFFEGFARLCDAFLELDITERLEAITCPALVLVGECDILKTPACSERIHDRIAGSRLGIIPDAGHAVVIENPEAVAARIEAFLSHR